MKVKFKSKEIRGRTTFWNVQERKKVFDPQGYFKEYHYFEKGDVCKKAETQILANYGHGEKLYNIIHWSIVIENNHERGIEYYNVMSECITDEEFKQLTPFCCCCMCKQEDTFYLMGACEGCFQWERKEDLTQHNINEVRAYKQSLNGKRPPFRKVDICCFLISLFVIIFVICIFIRGLLL